jgi:SpoVK/Ycf46/Vps4 family AAA+-type ATPase
MVDLVMKIFGGNKMKNQNALKAYREKQENIARLIEGIRGKLETDAKQPDITWASVGSLGHVEELLRELDEFLS